MRDDCFTVSDLARRFKISEVTVRRLERAGKIASIRIGRILRFEPAAVESFLRKLRRRKIK